MVSLRKVLGGIGEPAKLPLRLWSSFGHRAPHSLRTALDGMTDPGVGAWHELGIAFASENNVDSHEAQGMATDGTNWYLSSNGSKRIIIYDQHWNRLFTVSPTDTVWDAMRNDAGQPSEDWGQGEDNPHFGALCVHESVLYVPVQGPRGVWRLDTKTASQTWLKPFALPKDGSPLPEDDMFAWCAVHPVTGRLYTSNFRHPKMLHAYDRNTLQYLPERKIGLGSTPIDLDKVQGGTFTDRARLILVRDDFVAVFCFSSLNGHCFGAKLIGEDWSEAEAVTVRPWNIGGGLAIVHIFELDNDIQDDCYLHSFGIPDPARL